MRTASLILFFLMGSFVLNAQTSEVTILTSAECDECKERIENKLNYTKGIKYADLDPVSQKLIVRFQSNKITVEEIKKMIVELGYDADEMKANKEAQDNLPACCKPGAHH